MKLLVVGANGQVGTELCLLEPNDCQIIGLGREKLDITNAEQVAAVIVEQQPDFIVNASAYTAVDKAEEEIEMAYAVNHNGPLNLARSCHALNIPLIHISTDYVFDGTSCRPYTEDDTTQPINIYGRSKLSGEVAVRESCPQHIILRSSWVFGRFGNNFVKTMLRLGQQRNELSVVNDQQGCPSAAYDIAEAIIKICQALALKDNQNAPWGTYHFSGTPATNWYLFAHAIFSAAAKLGGRVPSIMPVSSSEYPTPAKRPHYTVLNCRKIERVFGIQPPGWQAALDRVVAACINH